MRLSRVLRNLVIAGAGVMVLIQLVPYGRDHDNPPVTAEPSWRGPRTRALAVQACFDCHSNETEWPWYSNVAPMSWLTQRDVDDGRAALNLSEFDREQDEAKDAAETVADDEMPPLRYVLAHSRARLSDGERRALMRGLAATLGGGSGGNGDQGGHGEN